MPGWRLQWLESHDLGFAPIFDEFKPHRRPCVVESVLLAREDVAQWAGGKVIQQGACMGDHHHLSFGGRGPNERC